MENLSIDHLSVRDLLRRYPGVLKVFISFDTQCVGCSLERFCTLDDVAEHYSIPSEQLKDTIINFIQSNNEQEKK